MTSRLIRIGVAMAVIVSLTACGANSSRPGDGTASGSISTPSPLPSTRKFLAVTPEIAYDEQAVALASRVDSGPGYTDIISNMSFPTLFSHFNGAVIGDLDMTIIFTSEANQAVRVTDVKITSIEASRKAFSGTYLPIAHQGGQEAYEFTANMNQPVPRLSRTGSGQSFPDFNIQLSSGEQSTIGVKFTASSGSFKWFLTVTYLVGENRHSMVVRSPGGYPFAVTARAKRYSVTYVNDPFSGLHLQEK